MKLGSVGASAIVVDFDVTLKLRMMISLELG